MGIAGMIGFVTGALVFPVMGRLLDRFGFRRIALACAPGMALVYLGVALLPGSYALFVMLMVLGGVFGAGTSAIVYTRPVTAAFSRQRGLALGAATTGTSIAAMLAPPLLAASMSDFGWRAGFVTLAALTALVGLPIALALIGRAREAPVHASDDAPSADALPQAPDATFREAVRGARFWLLVAALAAINIPGAGVVGQLAPLVSDKGLAEGAVAIVMSLYAAGLLAGRLITGFALDRLPAPAVAAFMTFIPAIGMALLMISTPSFALAALAVGLIGLQQGSEVDILAFFVSRAFGLKHYGAIYGAISMAGAFSSATGLVLFGKVHDLTGGYDAALLIGGAAFCVGALAFAAIGRAR
jgi:MFS family permease